MHEPQIQSCMEFLCLLPFHLSVLVLSFSAANLPKEINSADPNFLKEKNDMRINNLPDVEYARRSVSLMNRLRSDRNDEAGFSIKEKGEKKRIWDKMSRL